MRPAVPARDGEVWGLQVGQATGRQGPGEGCLPGAQQPLTSRCPLPRWRQDPVLPKRSDPQEKPEAQVFMGNLSREWRRQKPVSVRGQR